MNETVKSTLETRIAALSWEIEEQREFVSSLTVRAEEANKRLQALLAERRALQDHLAVHA